MPICPYCRRPVTSAYTVWCTCGTNLSKYSNLPNTVEEIKPWLNENSPETLKAYVMEGNLLDQAKKALISEQEASIQNQSKTAYEVAQVSQLFQDFLAGCGREEIAPNSDVGLLRRERYKQQKKAGVIDNLPVKNFKQTPAYFFRISFGRQVEEFNLTVDGELYRHQMNVPDPFPIEELLKFATVEKISEGLRQTLVELLKQKQSPPAASGPADEG